MRRSVLVVLAALALGHGVAAASCALEGFNRVEETVAPADGGVDADPDVAETGPTGCNYVTYPGAPSAGDGPSLPDFVVAVRSIQIEESIGLDLDSVKNCVDG